MVEANSKSNRNWKKEIPWKKNKENNKSCFTGNQTALKKIVNENYTETTKKKIVAKYLINIMLLVYLSLIIDQPKLWLLSF